MEAGPYREFRVHSRPQTHCQKIVGAIGLSGGSADQDGQCAKAGADAVK
ncbi:MAG: heme-binding protein [candidate division NC10 bacterium]